MAAYAMTELDDKKDGEGGNNKKAADTAADGNTAPEKENATEAKDDSNSTVHGFGSSPSKAPESNPTTDGAAPTPKDSNDPPIPAKNNDVGVEKETEVVSIEQKSSAEVTPNNNDRKRSHSTMEEPPSSFNPPPRQNDLFRNNNKANVSILPERNVSSDSGDHNVEHRAKKIAVEKI